MLSIGIIWNPAYKFRDDILNDIGNMVNLKYHIDIKLGTFYRDFIYDIYANEEKYKIDKKYNNLKSFQNTEVTIVLFEFDESIIEFHKQKNKEVYKQLNDLKVFVRNTYDKKIENYYFDNIFHCSDDYCEYESSKAIIKKYLSKILANELQLLEGKERAKVYVKRKN